MNPRHLLATALPFVVSAIVFAPGSSQSQPNPAGPEVQVNTYTTGFQRLPAVSADSSGRFVVAFDGDGAGLGGYFGVFAQRYTSSGAPLGENFLVGSYTTGGQSLPAVVSSPDNGFIVTWYGFGSPGNDQDGASVHARRFSPSGAALGPQFQVNSVTTGYQYVPDIAVAGSGSFVLVWQSEASTGTDQHATSIQARRFSSSGTPLGSDFQVNTFTTYLQLEPSVASHDNGAFVVIWESWDGPPSDPFFAILGQRFASDGEPQGAEFLVNSLTAGYQVSPDVVTLPDGGFLVVWSSSVSSGTDVGSRSIQARRFSSSGNPVGSDFQVNSYTTGSQAIPSISEAADGSFIVAWQSGGSSGSDTDNLSIQARQFTLTGVPLGPDFQVNTYTTSDQQFAAVAADPDGNLLVAWEGLGSGGSDNDNLSVHARIFDQLFRDGFESGDTSRWELKGSKR